MLVAALMEHTYMHCTSIRTIQVNKPCVEGWLVSKKKKKKKKEKKYSSSTHKLIVTVLSVLLQQVHLDRLGVCSVEWLLGALTLSGSVQKQKQQKTFTPCTLYMIYI